MTQQTWTVFRFSSEVTDDVVSMQYSTGRQTQFDSYSPGGLVLTIRNNENQASGYNLNDRIELYAGASLFSQYFYVQEVLYNDLPGDGKGSTATIICTDLLGRLGRIQVFDETIASAKTLLQIYNEFNSLMPTSTEIFISTDGDSTATAETSYTGTALNRLNLNMVTEQGWVGIVENYILLYGRSNIDSIVYAFPITFAREASGSSTMGYSDIKRIALGSNYLNSCVVTPPVATAQKVSDATGVAAYGIYGAEFSTVDNSATQAESFASWQVQSRSDPDQLSFQISVSDTANNITKLLDQIYYGKPTVTVTYAKPGSPTTFTDKQIMQGFTMSITPSKTDMVIFTSPLTYSNFFILNDDTFGVLNTSRLGW